MSTIQDRINFWEEEKQDTLEQIAHLQERIRLCQIDIKYCEDRVAELKEQEEMAK